MGEIHFLDQKGDTLSLVNEDLLQKVMINDDVFLYDTKFGFKKVVEEINSIVLAVNDYFDVVNIENKTAYDQSSSVSSVTKYSTITDGSGALQKLKIKGDIVLKKERQYIIIDKNNRSHLAKKLTFLKIFPKQKNRIEKYINENQVDFSKEDDLIQLLKFSSTANY